MVACTAARASPSLRSARTRTTGEMITRFSGEGQVVAQDCGQRSAGIVDLPGDSADRFEVAL